MSIIYVLYTIHLSMYLSNKYIYREKYLKKCEEKKILLHKPIHTSSTHKLNTMVGRYRYKFSFSTYTYIRVGRPSSFPVLNL